MSRPASGGDEVLANAREAIAAAQTVEQLRQAQAVVLPVDFGLSLADTALVIGVSPGWAWLATITLTGRRQLSWPV